MRQLTENMESDASSPNIYAYVCLLLCSFVSAFSMPGGRFLLMACLLLLCVDLIVSRRMPRLPRTAWIGFAFLAMLATSTVLSDRFILADTKLDKLFWFVGLPVTSLLVTSSWRLKGVLGAYAAGAGVLAVKTYYNCIRLCVESAEEVREGLTDYKTVLINGGSMTDGQRFMLGVILAVGLILMCRQARRSAYLWWVLLAMQVLGLVLTFKRGSLLCAVLLLGIFALAKTSWKYLLLLLAVVVAIVFLPPVRSRLSGLSEEFQDGKGGRLMMWKEIAPELVKERPLMGIGYRMLTNEDMVKIAPGVERDRDHLHSNPVQVIVDGGIVGLLLYLAWMLSGFSDAAVFMVRSRFSPLSLAAALMFAGLFLHGIVEYNLGDAEIVLLYGLTMGCCAAGVTISSDKSSGRSEVPVSGR